MRYQIGPDLYDEIVALRRRARELEGENGSLRAMMFDLESRLNAAAARSLAWEMYHGPQWLEVHFKLDPRILQHARAEREAFNVAAGNALRDLWEAYRAKHNPVSEAPDAEP